jgi:hypothetical protein
LDIKKKLEEVECVNNLLVAEMQVIQDSIDFQSKKLKELGKSIMK